MASKVATDMGAGAAWPDLDDLAIFVVIAEEENLTRAAERLGLPKSSVSRKLLQLEEQLGARLLRRTPQGMRKTEAGAQLLARAAPALATLRDALSAVTTDAGRMSGKLRVSVPHDFGLEVVGLAVQRFLQAYPGVEVELFLSDRQVDLVREGFDIAVRVGTLHDDSVVARPLGSITGFLVASPQYLAARGELLQPDDLLHHDCIAFMAPPFSTRWRLRDEAGVEVDVEVRAVLAVNSLRLICSAAIAGLGVARMPLYASDAALGAKQLVRVLPAWSSGDRPTYVVHAQSPRIPDRVRALVAHLLADPTLCSRASSTTAP